MLICDANKKVGKTVPISTTLGDTIQQHKDLKCMQVCYAGYSDTYNNDGPYIKSIIPPDTTIYLHSSVRTNLSNTAENSRYVVPSSIKHVNGIMQYTQYFSSSVIAHYGCKGNLRKTCESLAHIVFPTYSINDYPLLLENAAGEGTELGVTTEEIRHVFESMSHPKIGMCLDTCHAFAAGYHVEEVDALTLLLQELEDIAPKRLKMVHLNDSVYPYASHRDRHANIKHGYIWSNNTDSLDYLLQYGADMGIHFILETPPEHDDLLYLRQHHLRLRR